MNLYEFCANNSIGLNDRFGLDVDSCVIDCQRTMKLEMLGATFDVAAQHIPKMKKVISFKK